MLRIHMSRSTAQAQSYYCAELSRGDYYAEGQERAGQWGGKGAQLLGLSGQIEGSDFNALVDNIHPHTGEQLTAHHKGNRTPGYDFTFNAPKSLSLLYEYSRDERFLNAFREAVSETMSEIEMGMQTRVRKGSVVDDRVTGNLVYGEFVHFTARSSDGISIPDPHLHSHCFVMNATFDQEENQWKAGKFLRLKQDAPFYEAVFHSKLSQKVKDLGIEVERDGKFWTISGIEKDTLDAFSNRTKQIEKLAEERGIESDAVKANLAATTRHHKLRGISHENLRDIWQARLTDDEKHTLDHILAGANDDPEPPQKTAKECLDYALSHEFERQTVCPLPRLKETALRYGVGEVSVEEINEAFAAHDDLIVQEMNGREMATTRALLQMEKEMVAFTYWTHNTRPELNPDYPIGEITDHSNNTSFALGKQQKKAVEHVLNSAHRVMAIEGKAGTGKTTSLAAMIDGIEQGGKDVLCLAPTGDAAYDTMRKDGEAYHCVPMQNAHTLARFLVDEKLQAQAENSVLIIDEAGLMSTGDMHRLFCVAEEQNARVVLVGDTGQHRSVNQGDAFRILQKEAQLDVVSIDEIRRQKNASYRQAVKSLSEGKLMDGFDQLDAMDAIKQEGDDVTRYRQLADDYEEAISKGKKVLVVSPTHAEGNQVTQAIRQTLQKAGHVSEKQVFVTRLKNCHLTESQRKDHVHYEKGQVVRFHQNAKQIKRGEQFIISRVDQQKQVWMTGTDGTEKRLDREQAKRFNLYKQDEIPLASGDRIRITEGGKSREGKRLNNGAIYEVDHVDKQGQVVLSNGWTLDSSKGNVDHGYVTTSHASQGKTVDHVFIAQSSASLAASSAEQFYVSASRGKHAISVYTDDKEALRENISCFHTRTSAHELVEAKRARQKALMAAHHTPQMMAALKYYATHIAKELTGWVEWFRDKPPEPENWQERVRSQELEPSR